MSKRTDIPAEEPKTIRAGDTIQWTRSNSDYPASDSWDLKYYLVKDDAEIATITGVADGDGHAITILASVTATWEAGRYFYQGRYEKGTEVYTEYEGPIEVQTMLADSGGAEWREHAEIALENIEAVLLQKASADNLSYAIAGRSLSKYSWAELQDMRTYYKAEVLRYNRRYGDGRSQRIEAEFTL